MACAQLLERRDGAFAQRLGLEDLGLGAKATDEAPAEIVALAEARVAAKKAKDFAKADALRAEIKAQGWVVEDTPKGPKLKRA